MKEKKQGLVFDIQRFSLHDGPGIRTTLFLKGCPLKCFWCQNPEGMNHYSEIQFLAERCLLCGQCVDICPNKAHLIEEGRHIYLRDRCVLCNKCVEVCFAKALVITGNVMSLNEVITQIMQDKIFYEMTNGGVTLSGGEPLAQPAFSKAILAKCKNFKLHTAIETSAFCHWNDLKMLLSYTDLVMVDIKHIEKNKHCEVTGVSNEQILKNIECLAQTNKSFVIRVPVVPTVNDTKQEMGQIAEFCHRFKNLKYLELIPFHHLGKSKYNNLGKKYFAKHLDLITKNKIDELAKYAQTLDVEVRIG